MTALQLWQSVVASLEQARYAEVGPQYAELSALLHQQRVAELLQREDRREWTVLAATARSAATLLQPVLDAARRLQDLPDRADVQESDVRDSDVPPAEVQPSEMQPLKVQPPVAKPPTQRGRNRTQKAPSRRGNSGRPTSS